MAKKQKFYVVWKGRKTGIFKTWEACNAQVEGYPGAEYKSFENQPQAEQAHKGAYAEHVTIKPKEPTPLSEDQFRRIGKPMADSYAWTRRVVVIPACWNIGVCIRQRAKRFSSRDPMQTVLTTLVNFWQSFTRWRYSNATG
jgi:hypothetical protein